MWTVFRGPLGWRDLCAPRCSRNQGVSGLVSWTRQAEPSMGFHEKGYLTAQPPHCAGTVSGVLDQGTDPGGNQLSLGSSGEKQDCQSRAVLGTEVLASRSGRAGPPPWHTDQAGLCHQLGKAELTQGQLRRGIPGYSCPQGSPCLCHPAQVTHFICK